MENENGFQFERLQVYQKSLDIVDLVYQITEVFPKDELFGLRS
ncbi:MAG: four helix bundle protein [Sedimentisphaerales bacterium]|nr:four helix bundle protein [Sedimentisphaerales bacterium]